MRRTFTIHVFERRLVLGVSMFESNIDPRRAKVEVKAAVLDQVTLGEWLVSWYRREKAWWSLRDNRELLQQLYRDLADGRIHVREEPEPRTLASCSPSGASSRPPRPLPELVVEPIEASDKSLLISSCPALLPRDGVLRYSYLLRGLEGQAVAVRLRSEDGQLLHQRELGLDETRDGPHGGEWSGEITEGPRAGECVHPRDGNCTLELVHDDSYRDAAPFRVSCLRRHTVDFEDVLFNSDSAVLMPDYRDCVADPFHPDEESITGLRALAVCLRQQSLFPEQAMLIAGHTDSKGSKQHNLELSQLRADNVLHALRGDAQSWAANAMDRHGVRDWQQILAWVHRSFGWDCDPGSVDGVAGWRSKRALRRFAGRWSEVGDWPLAEADAPTLDHWRAFFALFDIKLADILGLADVAELASKRAALRFVDDARKSVGCGEHLPRIATADGVREQGNRRVEIMFFDPGEEPRLDCHVQPGVCAVELCELAKADIYEIEYIPCVIRTPVAVFVVPGELGARVGTCGKALGKYFVVGTFGPPREDVYPWRVRIDAGRPPIPVKLLYRRHGEERELCWAALCSELYFGSGGWLAPELYVVDGPELEPTATLEGDRIRISGVQQGDVIIAEEQSTLGKLKGRGEVYVVKNFTWNDLQRAGGQLKFWGPLRQLPDELKTAVQSALSYMLDTRPGRVQEQHRLAIVKRVHDDPYDPSTGTGGGKLHGVSVGTAGEHFGLCLAPVPSAGGLGNLPRDAYHFHVGMLFPNPYLTYEALVEAAKVYEDQRVAIEERTVKAFDGAKVAPTTGLLGLDDVVIWSQCTYVQQLLDGLVAMLRKCWPRQGARLHFHSYEQGIKRYIDASNPHYLHAIDPVRNIEVILDQGTDPSLREPREYRFRLDNGEDFRTSGYGEIRQIDFFVTSHGELFLYHAETRVAPGLDATALKNGWLMLADALGEF